MIHDTASTSTMHAIAAAREVADPEARRRGGSQHLTVYTSEQSHSSRGEGRDRDRHRAGERAPASLWTRNSACARTRWSEPMRATATRACSR